MIKEFVEAYEANKDKLQALLSEKHPEGYIDLVKAVVTILKDVDIPGGYRNSNIDPTRIHEIDDGSYQGTLLYIIGSNDYQPSDYWSVFVSYGSCSGCDTLQAINAYSHEPPNPEQVTEYMQLALHIVQGLKKVGEPEV